jgi:lysozyme family protein
MTAANLSRSLDHIFGSEGGFTKDSRDAGNWTGGRVGRGRLLGTKFGIAANSYPGVDIKSLTIEKATAIYKQDYAAKIRFDELPSGVDFATLDFAINSGPKRAGEFLQRVVGVNNVDGWIGPATVKTVAAMPARDVIDQLCDQRLAYLKRLSTWPTYGRGWLRRVASVRAFALSLA